MEFFFYFHFFTESVCFFYRHYAKLKKYENSNHYNISIKSVPEYRVLSLRRVVPTYYSEGELWRELCAFAKTQDIALSGETFSIYHDAEYKEQDVDIELCAPVNKLMDDVEPFQFRMTEPVPIMASTMV